MPDIDIDFVDRDHILEKIRHINASIREADGSLKKHNTGVYYTEIPYNPITNSSNIDYKEAEKRGYFKIDFLNVNLYKDIKNENHLKELINTEPLWDLLESEEFSNLLFHINGHSDILKVMKPKSIEELAAVLAMIRPAKRHLVGKSWNEIMIEVWRKPDNDEYYFKKSHAIAYATAVVVQMNLICETIGYEFS